ncbi:MAG TPA: DUF4124 domain-containing protein [Burkholderiales bacterium]
MNKRIAVGLGLALGLLAAGTQAATIYKYRGADGQIAYSTTRPQGVAVIEEMDSKALADDPRTQYHARDAIGSAPAPTAAADAHLERIARADASIERAQQNLKNAQAALEAGREPQPGERNGTASGFSRLTPAYEERVAALEQAVDVAQRQLDEAYRARRGA